MTSALCSQEPFCACWRHFGKRVLQANQAAEFLTRQQYFWGPCSLVGVNFSVEGPILLSIQMRLLVHTAAISGLNDQHEYLAFAHAIDYI